MSIATARREVLPLLSTMTHHCKPAAVTEAVATWLELDAGEVSYLTGSGKDTQKVSRIVEHAREHGRSVAEPEVREVEEEEVVDDDRGDGAGQAGLGDFA